VIAVTRESWILIGFVALAAAALVVSAAGWTLFARERQQARTARATDQDAVTQAAGGRGPAAGGPARPDAASE
jgi:hypothetical protein